MVQRVLVTGGAGYIGSHTCVELLQAGYEVVVLDNLSNASPESLKRVQRITGREVPLVEGDIRDRALLDRLFAEHEFAAVLHFAGLKAVGESVARPLSYYDNNVHGSLVLLQAMAAAGVFRLVFSSSATVYGEPEQMPISESCPLGVPTNPYGRSKLMIEQMLADLARSDSRWQIGVLRYFNPGGRPRKRADRGGPQRHPQQPAALYRPGGHRQAGASCRCLAVIIPPPTAPACAITSMWWTWPPAIWRHWILSASAAACRYGTWAPATAIRCWRWWLLLNRPQAAPYPTGWWSAAPGDIAICYADPSKAREELGWVAQRGLEQMMLDAWRWQSSNPEGYGGSA